MKRLELPCAFDERHLDKMCASPVSPVLDRDECVALEIENFDDDDDGTSEIADLILSRASAEKLRDYLTAILATVVQS